METVITGLGKYRENVKAGIAVIFLLIGVILATGLLAMAFASAQAVQPSQVTVYGHSSPAVGGLDRSHLRGGGGIGGFHILL